ncbi:MAG: SMC-Scp complex subunit ScpB [Cardiobacteriaceae bacterium]|nr:SMC-Scp complex subunit ScpB [Cardiobacteriaceae bacterium]
MNDSANLDNKDGKNNIEITQEFNNANRIEALLFTRDKSLKIKDISAALNLDETEINRALNILQDRYRQSAISIIETASGWRLQLKSAYFPDLTALANSQPVHFSNAFWETLAYIAYHQPVTRADIDAVRGVSTSSGIYRQLFDLEWIEVVGKREVPGRPELLATTQNFLDDFALKNIEELPNLPEIKQLFEKDRNTDKNNPEELENNIETDIKNTDNSEENIADNDNEDDKNQTATFAEITG